MSVRIYGTLGPACRKEHILREMIAEGMSGVRLNLSHVSLQDSTPWLEQWRKAGGGRCDLLIDMQGPEMRIGSLPEPLQFEAGDQLEIPITDRVIPFLETGQEALLDDGRILARVLSVGRSSCRFLMLREGELSGGKSIKIPGVENTLPALTTHDIANLADAAAAGVTGVMQPFVRSADDLKELRRALFKAGAGEVQIFAKIENRSGIRRIREIVREADWVVIARGDLGNDMPLWELPTAQRRIAAECRAQGVRFIVVTQMLASMEHSPVPTRAEISDIDHAIMDGASGVMVTGETAVGEYPVEVMRYLTNTVRWAEAALEENRGK